MQAVQHLLCNLNEGRINRAQFHYVVQAIQRNPQEWRQIYPANETIPDLFQVYLPRPVMFIPVDMSQAYRNVEELSVEPEMMEDEVPGGSTDGDREESSDDEAPVPTLPGGNDIVAAFRWAAEEEIAVMSQTYGPWSELNDESETETDDEEQALSSASTNLSIATTRVVNMAATVRTGTRDVHIEERLGMNMRVLLTSMTPCTFYCISDVGADTTIFGDGWVVIGFSRRRANLIGFDHKAAKKKNLPICSAVTIVKMPNGKVLLKAHEGVQNKGSPISLLSEYQTRDHGCVVDSVHRGHRKDWDGNYGTQSFQPTADIIIPLSLCKALMTFPIREPTPE
jgi:hypothetical protein